MDIQNIVLFLCAILDLILGYIIVSKKYKSESNIAFGLFVVWVVLWTGGIAMFRLSSNFETMLLWNRVFILASGLIASSFLHFTYIYPFKERLSIWKTALIYLPNLIILWAVMEPGAMIKDIIIRDWGNESILGWGYIYFGAYFGIIWLWGTINLIRSYIKAKGIFRSQIVYILIGLSISIVFGATFNLIFILFGNYRYIWLGPYASFLFIICVTYAITRYRLMDIRVAFRKAYIYIGAAIFTYAAYYGISTAYLKFFGNIYNTTVYAIGAVVSVLFVIALFYVNNKLQEWANEIFFTGLYQYQESIKSLGRELNKYTDLERIINLIIDTIKNTMSLNRAGVLLVNAQVKPIHYEIAKTIGFNEKNGISLVQDNFLTKYLQKTKSPLIKDELELLIRDAKNKNDKDGFAQLKTHMDKIEASLCLPLISGDKLIGIIVLGTKSTNEVYTKEDMELLITVSSQASIAVENANLYKEIKSLNKNLQKRVDEQTRNLQELLHMKTEFLTVASHQLNTPISVIKSMLDMVVKGDLKQHPEQEKQFVMNSYVNAIRLERIVRDLLLALDLEGESFELNLKPAKINEVIENAIKEKLIQVKESNLTIKFIPPKEELPFVLLDADKFTDVITGLIDNSINYTSKGGIEISAYMEDGMVKIKIKDTGMGITKEELKKLFQKFDRTKRAITIHPDGSGLGLYIAKQITELNGGEIEIKSEGEEQGTEVIISLKPMKEEKTDNA